MCNNFRKPFYLLTAIMLGVMVFTTFNNVPVKAQGGTMQRTISVVGNGTAQGKPDIVLLSLGVEVIDPDVTVALANANAKIEAITAFLKSQGIDEKDIQTTNFSVYSIEQPVGIMPVMPPAEPNSSNSSSGSTPAVAPAMGAVSSTRQFQAQILLTIKIRDISKVGPIIRGAAETGVNTIQGLSFALEDATALEQQARDAALKDARFRADQLAAGLGLKVGQVISVEEMSNGGIMPVAAYGGKGGMSDASISAGQLSVSMMVRVVFAIE